VQIAKDLSIQLASDDEGHSSQITTIKAEERLRANLAEANYKAHLENLRYKECLQEDEGLDLAIVRIRQPRSCVEQAALVYIYSG
jgi:hypothetical protein